MDELSIEERAKVARAVGGTMECDPDEVLWISRMRRESHKVADAAEAQLRKSLILTWVSAALCGAGASWFVATLLIL